MRSWTDQGVLACLRINQRGDRRYARDEIARFLAHTEGRDHLDGHAGMADAGSARGTGFLARSAELAARTNDVAAACRAVAELLCSEHGYGAATLVGHDAAEQPLVGSMRADVRLAQRATARGSVLLATPRRRDGAYQAALPFGSGHSDGGVLLLAGTAETRTAAESALLAAVAAQLDLAAAMGARIEELQRRQERAELLLSIDSEMSARLDPTHVLDQLVDRAIQAFGAQHAGVFLGGPVGTFRAQVTRNLSAEFCQIVEHSTYRPMTAAAQSQQRVITATDYTDDPRSRELRTAYRREGINSVAVAPLISEGEAFGVLCLYHDQHHEWPEEDLELLKRLADHGAGVMRGAQDYSQMTKWTAQLQSIQQLGARLTRLRSVTEIGQAICAELVQLIDTHNTRVYRVVGDDCQPVAWRGHVGEYESENGEQLRLKVGEGITGWVARFGLAQNVPDAAGDKRAKTIPGTNEDLDESLLLAPMLFEDVVIGVIVLAKLGLNQFTSDDLRLLEIYAAIAAQAMANADVTERLHAQSDALARQVASQRELLRVTESILGTLDTQALLQEIAGRLNSLVKVDNTAVLLHDPIARRLNPIFAVGVHAKQILKSSMDESDSVSGKVLRSGEAELVSDELNDSRVARSDGLPSHAGALIVAPLRSGERVQGVLALERLGAEARFSDEEFDLVKLFAAHVSIALRNAEAHHAVEIRAETDRLTGLYNHGALTEQLARFVERGTHFGMLMVDLDRFKEYNDRYGHQAGNVMLQRVAEVLRASCRDSDLVFRFGGDEFVLMLPDTGLPGTRTVAAKVHNAVALIDGKHSGVGLTCSVGVAAYPRDGSDGATVILAADRACYAAKRSGRDRIATATEGLALAGEFQPTEPTPLEPEAFYSAA